MMMNITQQLQGTWVEILMLISLYMGSFLGLTMLMKYLVGRIL